MTNNHRTNSENDITSNAYREKQYRAQMESWLEFAWNEKDAATYSVSSATLKLIGKKPGRRAEGSELKFWRAEEQFTFTNANVAVYRSGLVRQHTYVKLGSGNPDRVNLRHGEYYYMPMLWENWKTHYREITPLKRVAFFVHKTEAFHELRLMADFMEEVNNPSPKPKKVWGPKKKGRKGVKKVKKANTRHETKVELINLINEYEEFNAEPKEWLLGDLRKKLVSVRRKHLAAEKTEEQERKESEDRLRFLNRRRFSQKRMVEITVQNKKFLTSLPRGGKNMPSAQQLLVNFALDELRLDLGDIEIEYNKDTKEFGVWKVSEKKDDIYWWQPLTDIIKKMKGKNRYARRKQKPGYMESERKRKQGYREKNREAIAKRDREYRARIKEEE
tara:strand:+ start:1445 stop:2611 length:1167 start_codon:yes stop_codon:yes gene_type:complete